MTDGKRHNRWLVFSVVAVGVFMSTLDGSIVNIALPTIMQDLGISLDTAGWVMMIYLLTVSTLLLGFGRLSDIRGRRWVYTWGLGVFSVGSLCCGLSTDAFYLIASRALQGVGAAMIMSCTQAIVVETFPAADRGRALGMIGAVVASGLTLGPPLGGWILHLVGWQAIFYVNIPVGVVTAIAAHRLLAGGVSDTSRAEPFDWRGAIYMAFCLGTFLVAITHGYEWGYGSPGILGLSAISILALGALVREELISAFPLLRPALLRIRLFTMPVIATLILFAGLFTIIFLMPFFLIHPCGFSVKQTGYIMVTPFIMLFAIAPVSGAVSDRIGSRLLCTAGILILTISFYLLSRVSPRMVATEIAWRLAVTGVGIAIFTPPNNAAIMSAVPPRHMGVAAGTIATVRNLGMVLGIALAGTLFNTAFFNLTGGERFTVYRPELEPMFMTAFRNTMLAGMVVSGIGIIVTFFRGAESHDH